MNRAAVPNWFVVISVLALAWNVLGFYAFIGSMILSSVADDVSGMIEQSIQQGFPLWAKIAYGMTVVGGTLGSLGLVLKRKWAYPLLVVSLVGVIGQTVHTILFSTAWELERGPIIVMSSLTLGVSILLIWMARTGIRRRWLL